MDHSGRTGQDTRGRGRRGILCGPILVKGDRAGLKGTNMALGTQGGNYPTAVHLPPAEVLEKEHDECFSPNSSKEEETFRFRPLPVSVLHVYSVQGPGVSSLFKDTYFSVKDRLSDSVLHRCSLKLIEIPCGNAVIYPREGHCSWTILP